MNLKQLLTLLVLTLPLVRPGHAQCPAPDNLDTGFPCGGANTSVPQRGFSQQALGICWRDCALDAQANYIAKWGPATLFTTGSPPGTVPSCGWYQANLRIFAGSTLMWGGTMHLTYSRTWTESMAVGQSMQVWRFLANGDLRPSNANALPCGTPSCAAPNGNRVRFTGYVDYTFDCGSTIQEHAWMLTHACDAIDHKIGFPRGGIYHPGRDYTFVGPAAGFVIGAGTANEAGTTVTQSMRFIDASALPARCGVREPLLNATNTPGPAICMCGTGPANWFQAQLTVLGSYGSVLFPLTSGDPFRSFPIGQWTNPTAYPGVEELRWNCNEGQWVHCTGVGRAEYFYGVTTSGGFPAFTLNASAPPIPLPLTFVDQSNSALLPNNVATRNRPYRSDHILNLNL